jgi:hypothetical protein
VNNIGAEDDDDAHGAWVDTLLDTFPGSTVIAAEGYDERARAFGYAPKAEPTKKSRKSAKRISGQRELEQ